MSDYAHHRLDRQKLNTLVFDAQEITPNSRSLNTYTPDRSRSTYIPDRTLNTYTPDRSKNTEYITDG